jgi:hypothetical protein
MAVLLGWWAVLLVGLLLLTSGGPLVLVLPVGLVAVLVVANTVVIIRHTGPEETALEPGRLRQADASRHDGVGVWAARTPRRSFTDRGRTTGTLAYVGGRLSFTVDDAPASGEGSDPLAGVAVLDAPVREVALGPRPGWTRPALVVDHNGAHHVLDLSPQWDLGAGAVGALVAAAWWDQLAELGARTAT